VRHSSTLPRIIVSNITGVSQKNTITVESGVTAICKRE
jgi:hypothetical protein